MRVVERTAYFDQSRLLKRFFLFSAALHLLFFIYLSVKSLLFPSVPKETFSALRVDLVALPDQKKTETIQPVNEAPKTIEVPKNPVEKQSPKIDRIPEPDPGDYSIAKKKKAEHQKKEKEAQKKLKQALDRIRALERVKALTAGTEVKGNQISKGTSLSQDAKTALEASYSDVVLERVRSNWELPKWLTEKGLSADVIVFIDARGAIRGMKFTKPSGNPQFDSEVKRTLEVSAPFPIPPEGTTGDLAREGIALAFPL